MKSLIIISNDEIYLKKNIVSSNYNDTINIIEGLNKKFHLHIVSRKTYSLKNFSIKLSKKIYSFNSDKSQSLDKGIIRILMISVTPLNVLKYIFLISKFKNFKAYVLIRSDGYKEYDHKYGILGRLVYHLIFNIVKQRSKILSVSNHLTNVKTRKIIEPSELDKNWFKKNKNLNMLFPKLLYFGRFRKEKGVFSLIEIFSKLNENYKLTIAGDLKKINKTTKNIEFKGNINNQKKIIELYDRHNIFILPSYTEASPKVIKESLSRLRPVIIFDELKHLKNKYFGIFMCKRNPKQLVQTINYIFDNYKKIQKKIKKNKLVTKKEFQIKLCKIIDE